MSVRVAVAMGMAVVLALAGCRGENDPDPNPSGGDGLPYVAEPLALADLPVTYCVFGMDEAGNATEMVEVPMRLE